MKNRVQYEKEPKNLLSRCNHNSTCNLQLSQGTVFDESDNANSMGMLRPSKGIYSKYYWQIVGDFLSGARYICM